MSISEKPCIQYVLKKFHFYFHNLFSILAHAASFRTFSNSVFINILSFNVIQTSEFGFEFGRSVHHYTI
jgi:hypothetical protein